MPLVCVKFATYWESPKKFQDVQNFLTTFISLKFNIKLTNYSNRGLASLKTLKCGGGAPVSTGALLFSFILTYLNFRLPTTCWDTVAVAEISSMFPVGRLKTWAQLRALRLVRG